MNLIKPEAMLNIRIRAAEESDFPEIYNLIKVELGYDDLDKAETLKRLTYFRNSPDWATFIAFYGGEAAGFIGITKGMAYNIDGFYSQIMALAVSAKYRRLGLGTLLVKKAEEWSLSQGITDICVNSNMKRLEAHMFYEKNGYIKKSYSFTKTLKG